MSSNPVERWLSDHQVRVSNEMVLVRDGRNTPLSYPNTLVPRLFMPQRAGLPVIRDMALVFDARCPLPIW